MHIQHNFYYKTNKTLFMQLDLNFGQSKQNFQKKEAQPQTKRQVVYAISNFIEARSCKYVHNIKNGLVGQASTNERKKRLRQFFPEMKKKYPEQLTTFNRLQEDFKNIHYKTLRNEKILSYYTKYGFFQKYIGNSISRGLITPNSLLHVQPIIYDIYTSIVDNYHKILLKEKFMEPKIGYPFQFTCFSRAWFTQQQLEYFAENKGKCIQLLGFMSTSFDRKIPQGLMTNVLIQIYVQYQKRQNSIDHGYHLMVNSESKQKKVKQVLFNILNTFRIDQVELCENYTRLKLIYGSGAQLLAKFISSKKQKKNLPKNQKKNYQNPFNQQQMEEINYLKNDKFFIYQRNLQFFQDKISKGKQRQNEEKMIFFTQHYEKSILKGIFGQKRLDKYFKQIIKLMKNHEQSEKLGQLKLLLKQIPSRIARLQKKIEVKIQNASLSNEIMSNKWYKFSTFFRHAVQLLSQVKIYAKKYLEPDQSDIQKLIKQYELLENNAKQKYQQLKLLQLQKSNEKLLKKKKNEEEKNQEFEQFIAVINYFKNLVQIDQTHHIVLKVNKKNKQSLERVFNLMQQFTNSKQL